MSKPSRIELDVDKETAMSQNLIDTPETDAAVFGAGNAGKVRASFARSLERDRDRLREVNAELVGALDQIRDFSGISKKLQHGNPAELTATIGDIHQIADATLSKPKWRVMKSVTPLSDAAFKIIQERFGPLYVPQEVNDFFCFVRKLECDRTQLITAFEYIEKMTDSEMADGDGARDIARAALAKATGGQS